MYVVTGFVVVVVYAYMARWWQLGRRRSWSKLNLSDRVICMHVWRASRLK